MAGSSPINAQFDLDVIWRQTDQALTMLVEALSRRQVDRALAPAEQKLQTKLAALFKSQSLALLRSLGTLRSYFRESAASDFDDLFDSATLATSADMQELIQKAVEAAVISGGKAIIKDFKASINFSLTNPRAVAYTKNYAATAITNIDNTTRADIKRIILAGISDGASYSEVANNIKARYVQYAVGVPQKHIRSRAELISVTEIGNAYQQGNLIGVQTIADAGIKIEKYWLTSNDERVSDGCRNNQAQGWIDLDQAHASGDLTPLRFPGCRCVEQYRRKKG